MKCGTNDRLVSKDAKIGWLPLMAHTPVRMNGSGCRDTADVNIVCIIFVLSVEKVVHI